jgi:hypothetical protein
MSRSRLHFSYMIWKLTQLWHHRDTDPAAVMSTISGYLWALCLLFPGDTLARPTYRHMAEVASEEMWIVLFVTLATLQLWRLLTRPFKHHFAVDFAVKASAMTLWWFVALACMSAQWPLAAAMSDTFVVAFATLWDFLRLDPRQVYSGEHAQCIEPQCPFFRPEGGNNA